jgi:hypothetical protein
VTRQARDLGRSHLLVIMSSTVVTYSVHSLTISTCFYLDSDDSLSTSYEGTDSEQMTCLIRRQ